MTQPYRKSSRFNVNVMMFAIAFAALLADQISKRWVEANIPLGGVVVIPGLFPYVTLTNTQNTGAAFSMLQNAGVFFIIVAVVVSVLIVYYAPRLPPDDWLSRVGLGLQLGGALGNLTDRLRQGYVTDFIHFQIPQIGFDFPVWNVADMCIFFGVIILIISSFLRERKQTREIAAQVAAAQAAAGAPELDATTPISAGQETVRD